MGLKSSDRNLRESKNLPFHFGQPACFCPAWSIRRARARTKAVEARRYPSRLGDVLAASDSGLHEHQARHPRRHRQHPAHQAAPRVGNDRLHHPRQGRVHEPGPVRQGSGGVVHRRGCGERGLLRPGGDHRRGNGGQYRHRARARGQRAGLPNRDRHPRDAEPGEEGHAAARGRGADRGAGRALTPIRTTT